MFNSVSKIIAVLLIVGMNWNGLAAVFGTVAYFTDSAEVSGITITAGTLDVDANAPIFSPMIDATNTVSTGDLTIRNIGSLPFQYRVSATTTGDLCGKLNLTATNGTTTTSFNDFPISSGVISATSSEIWTVRASLANSLTTATSTCVIIFSVDAWQDNLSQGQGFIDHQEITSIVTAGSAESLTSNLSSLCSHNPNIVINEFLPNPIGDDDAAIPGGEWVELYNADDHPVDLNGWLLYTSNTSYGMSINSGNTNNGSTVIYPGGFLVVFRDGNSNFEINNSGAEKLRLFDQPIGEGVEDIDGVSYNAIAPEGKSFARIPDGIGEWIDPIPTPGAPNRLYKLEAANPQKLDVDAVGSGAEIKQAEQEQAGGAVLENDPVDLVAADAEKEAEENQEDEGEDGAAGGDEGNLAGNDLAGDNSDGGDQNTGTDGGGQAEGGAAGESAGGDNQQQGSDVGGAGMGQATVGGNENTGGGTGGNAGGGGGTGSGGDGGAGNGGQGSDDNGNGSGDGGDEGAGGGTGGGSGSEGGQATEE